MSALVNKNPTTQEIPIRTIMGLPLHMKLRQHKIPIAFCQALLTVFCLLSTVNARASVVCNDIPLTCSGVCTAAATAYETTGAETWDMSSCPITTSGNFVYVAVSLLDGNGMNVCAVAISDALGNTYPSLATSGGSGTNGFDAGSTYVANATVGAGEYWRITSNGAAGCTSIYVRIIAMSMSSLATSSVLDYSDANLSTVGVATLHAGASAHTPSQKCDVIVAAIATEATISGLSINSGLGILGYSNTIASEAFGLGVAYFQDTAATSIDPVWSWTTNTVLGSVINGFKYSTTSCGGGGGGTSGSLLLMGIGK